MKTALTKISTPAIIAAALFGGPAIMGTPAHADQLDCTRSLRNDGYTVTDEHAKICAGREANKLTQSRCVELFVDLLSVRESHAQEACAVADD